MPLTNAGNGRAGKDVAVQEFKETLDRYEHPEEVVGIRRLLRFAIGACILRSALLRHFRIRTTGPMGIDADAFRLNRYLKLPFVITPNGDDVREWP